jgi:hypothetical protein
VRRGALRWTGIGPAGTGVGPTSAIPGWVDGEGAMPYRVRPALPLNPGA